MNIQEQVQFINEHASRASISIIVNPHARSHEVKAVVVSAEYPLQLSNGEVFVVQPMQNSWGKGAIPFENESIARIAQEMQADPQRRSFKV